jgi:hypothetical protein
VLQNCIRLIQRKMPLSLKHMVQVGLR